MAPNPEPEQTVIDFDRQRPVVAADADRTVHPNLLEMEGWMLGIDSKQCESGVSGLPDGLRQGLVVDPEVR